MNPDILIVVAALDEADRISSTLAALALAFPAAPVWVADDGSTDATPEIARSAGATVVRSSCVIGKGQAMSVGVRAALERVSADDAIVVLCDGDLGDSARELSALVDALRRSDADLAVAAFATRVGGGFGFALAFARWAIRRRCGLCTRAPISGQRALRAGVARDVLPFAPGFGMEIGMTIDAVRAGHRVIEVNLDLAHRATGRTPAGFLHRARQLADFIRVYFARG
ncbi:MAG TPA: glycosyltransferase [Solirubrobacteraceae bacterium]|jgi:glycosyltransferase involved in cell wall biosynthesis|nr:glycosyltransferase [Solirubrobacteraceae bacterium]